MYFIACRHTRVRTCSHAHWRQARKTREREEMRAVLPDLAQKPEKCYFGKSFSSFLVLLRKALFIFDEKLNFHLNKGLKNVGQALISREVFALCFFLALFGPFLRVFFKIFWQHWTRERKTLVCKQKNTTLIS